MRKTFIAQTILFGISFGSIKFISLWQFSLLCPQGYLPSTFKGFYAFFLLGSTLIGALLLSAIIDQFHKYKKVYRFCFALTTFGIGLFAWVLQKEDRTMTLLISLFIIGFFGIGSLGIGMETSCETVFPIDSGIVAGMILSAGYFFYILLTIGTFFTRNLVSYEEYPTEQCSNGLFYQFFEFSDTTEVLSFIACSGLILCLLGLHARRRRYDYEAAAKLMRISVFNTSNSNVAFRHYPTATTSQTHLATEF
uniref:Uncharacterized protein n=1 Tax=Panagrolaimus davidi TaxID=227884 RepID=A0A914PK80_9BILA